MAPPPASDRYVAALGDAAQRHRHQRRKGTEVTYVSHLLAVGALVWEDGGAEDEAVAALLHDAVEDTGGQSVLDEVGERYGERVAHLVAACTDAWTRPKPPWRERKEAHLTALREEPDAGALRIFAADKAHNAGAIVADAAEVGADVWARFAGDRDGILWHYHAAHALLAEPLPGSRLTARLGALLDELEGVPAPAEGPVSDDLEVWRIPCLIFLGAGDVEFREQARRAADEIPDAEVLSRAGPDHYAAHTSETRPSSSQTQLPCATTFWADIR